MLQRIRFFLFLALAVPLFAHAMEMPEKLDYERDTRTAAVDMPQGAREVLLHSGLIEMHGNSSAIPATALDAMSAIFISSGESTSDAKRLVLVMTGLTIDGEVAYGKSYFDSEGEIVHFKTPDGVIALFFRGFDSSAVQKMSGEIEKSLAGAKKSALISALVPRAFAAEPSALCGTATPSTTGVSSPGLLKSIWGCAKGLGQGSWDATGGTAWWAAKTSFNTIFHPIATFHKAAEGFQKFRAMVSDIPGAFGDLKTAFLALPSNVQAKIGCQIVATVGVTAAIAYFTAGAGSPMLARVLASALDKVLKALPAGSEVALRVAAMKAKYDGRARSVAEARALIAAGPEGAEIARLTERFEKALDEVVDAEEDLGVAKEALTPSGRAFADVMEKHGQTTLTVTDARERLRKAQQAWKKLRGENVAFTTAYRRAAKPGSIDAMMLEAEDVFPHIGKSARRMTPAQKKLIAAYLARPKCIVPESSAATTTSTSAPARSTR